MKSTLPPRLSQYLLLESGKFSFYPATARRSRSLLAFQKKYDEKFRQLAEWRKTFAPRPQQEWDDDLVPSFVDQVYCRDLLRAVPEMVERTRKLAQLTLPEIEDQKSFAYLREAVDCYIRGLPQAAIALSRAAVEARLKVAASKQYGRKAVDEAGLSKIINDFAVRLRLLSRSGQQRVKKVKDAGDKVLHSDPAEADTAAFEVLEAARAVLLELRGR